MGVVKTHAPADAHVPEQHCLSHSGTYPGYRRICILITVALKMMLQQSTWGLSGCLAEPAHSSSAVKECLHFIAAAQVVWRGVVTLLGLMWRQGQRAGADGRENGVSHFHLLVRPIQEPLLFQSMAQSRASFCCWWQGPSCTSTLQARLGVYWGGILLRILLHPWAGGTAGELLPSSHCPCGQLPVLPVPRDSSMPGYLAALPADRELGAPAATHLLRGADDRLLHQTDRQMAWWGVLLENRTDTLHRRGSLRLEKQQQCCFQIKEVNVAHHVDNMALSPCHQPVSSNLWTESSGHRAHLLLAPTPHWASRL